MIVSVSTIEHIGWGENPHAWPAEIVNESGKVLRTVQHIKSLFAQNGQLILTVPLAYNPELDALPINNGIQLTEVFCLKRVAKDNRWQYVDCEVIKNIKYDEQFPGTNAWLSAFLRNRGRALSLLTGTQR